MIRYFAPIALLLAGCATPAVQAPSARQASHVALEQATNGAWRAPEDRARDRYRQPVRTLEFFGVKPGDTLVEIQPGGGWYTDILAPYAHKTGGRYIASSPEPTSDAAKAANDKFRAKLANKDVYGDVSYAVFSKDSASACAPGTADFVGTFRNVHDWQAQGWAEQGFKEMAACLKPGGILGVEEHRLPTYRIEDEKASTGYMHVATIKKLAADAGLVYVGSSEANANPKDHAWHPYGVWSLPPTRRGPPAGQPAAVGYDREQLDAIGESDRMTLKFRKPT